MTDRGGGANLGTATGRITVDTSQAIGSLNQLGSALTSFDAKAAQVGSTTSDFTQSTVGLAQGMQHIGRVSIGVGAAMASPFVVAAKSALDFEQGMANVNSVMDLTGTQFDTLSDTALQLGRDTVFTAEEAASGIETLGKSGLSYQDIMNGAAEATTNLAAAGGTTIPRAAEVMAAAINAFSLSGNEAVNVADALAGAANASQSDVNQLGIGLAQVAGVAAAANTDLYETTTFLALLADRGLSGSDAATSMKTAILALLSPTDKAAEEMANLGIELLDTENNFVGLEGASREFFDAWKRSGQTMSEFMDPLSNVLGRDAVRTILFGMQAIQNDLDGTGKGWSDYSRAVHEAGAAQEIAAERMDTVLGSIERLRGSISTLATSAGLPLLEFIRPLIDGAVLLVNALSNIPAPVLAAAAAFTGLLGSLTAIGGAFLLVGGYVLEAVARMEAAGVPVSRLIGLFTRLIGVLGLVTAAIAAVGLAIENNWFGLGDLADDLIAKFGEIKDNASDAADQWRASGAESSALEDNIYGLSSALARSGIPLLSDLGRTMIASVIPAVRQARTLFDQLTSKGISPLVAALKAGARFLDISNLFGGDRAADAVDEFADNLGKAGDIFAILRDEISKTGADALTTNLLAAGAAINEAFGKNIIGDTLLNLGQITDTLTADFNTFISRGLNPLSAALGAIGNVVANNLGMPGLAEHFFNAANAAQQFADTFRSVNISALLDGMTGLGAAVLAVGEALRQVTGIDITGFTERLALGIEAANQAWQNARAQGINPFNAALDAMNAFIESALSGNEQLSEMWDNFTEGVSNATAGVQGLMGSGLDRVGQLFDEIGTAISSGDFSGVLTAFQSLAADIGSQIQSIIAQVQTIDIPTVTANIVDVLVTSAVDLFEKVKAFFGFGTGGTETGQGGPGGSGGAATGAPVIDIPSVAVNIGNFIRGAVPDLINAVKTFFGFGGSGDPNGGGSFRGGAGPVIDIPTVTVNVGSFIGGQIANLADFLASHLGTGADPEGGGSFRGGQASVTLQSVAVNISSFIQGVFAALGDLASQVKSHIEEGLTGAKIAIENFTGWSLTIGPPGLGVSSAAGSETAQGGPGGSGGAAGGSSIGDTIRQMLTAAAIQVENFSGWSLTIESPEGGIDIDTEGIKADIEAKLHELLTVDQGVVDAAGNIGRDLGIGIGEALAAGIKAGIGLAGTDTGTGGPGGSGGAGAPSIGDAFAAFDQQLTAGLKQALEPEFDQVIESMGMWIEERKTNMFNAIFDLLFLPIESDITSDGQGGGLSQDFANQVGDALNLTLLPPDPGEDDLRAAEQRGQDIAVRHGEAVLLGAGRGVDSAAINAQAAVGGSSENMLGMIWEALTFPFREGATGAEGAEARDLMTKAIIDPVEDVPAGVESGIAGIAPDVQSSAQAGARALTIGDIIDAALAADMGGIDFIQFSTAVGQSINAAILEGVSGTADTLGGPGERGEAGTASAGIGSQIASQIASSLEGADFSAVGSALQAKIGTSLTEGATSGDAEGQVAGAAGGLGASVAESIASQIGAADFTLVGQALQAKIGSALITGAQEGGGGAEAQVAGAAGGLGASIAQSLAGQIGQADFSLVGQAIQAKIGQALTAAQSSTAAGAPGGSGGGGGTGLGASIAASISSQIAGADFSAVGNAIATAIGSSLGAATGNMQSAMTAVISAVVAAGQQAASQAQAIGNAIMQSAGGGIGPSAGLVISAVQAAVTTAIQGGVGSAAGGVTIGSTLMTQAGAGVGQGTGTLVSAVQAGVQAGISGGNSSAAGATVIGQTMMTNAGSGVGSATGSLTAAVGAAVQAGIDAGVAAGAGAARIGENIVAGIVAGINSGAGAVADAVASIVAAGIAAGQAEAESSSPSKKAIDLIGQPIAQGVEVGMLSGEDAVEQAGKRLAEGAIRGATGLVSASKDLEGFGKGLESVRGFDALSGQISSIADKIRQTATDSRSAVKDLISGMRSELERGASSVGGAADDLGSAVSSGMAAASSAGTRPDRSQFQSAKSVVGDLKKMKADVNQLEAFASQLDKVRGFHDLGDQLRQVAGEIETNRSSALDAAKGLMSDLRAEFNAAIKEFRQAGKDVGESISSGVSEGMESATTAATESTQSMTESMIQQLNPNLSRLPEMAGALGTETGEAVSAGLDAATPAVSESASGVGDAVTQGLSSAESQAEAAATDVVETTTQAMDTATTEQSEFARTIGELISSTFGEGFASGADPQASLEMVQGYHDGIRTAVTSIAPQVQQAGSQIGSAFSTGVDSINPTQSGKGLVDEVGTGVTSGVGQASDAASRAGSSIGNSLQSSIDEACAPVNANAQELTDSCIPQGIEAGEATASKVAQDAGENISDNLVDGLDVKKKDVQREFDFAGGTFGKSLAQGIGATDQDSVNAAQQVAQKAGGVDGSQQGHSVGESIGHGIAQGVTSTIPEIRAAVEKAVQEGIDAAKEKSKSKSPSEVFAEIGRDFSYGLALGMERGADAIRSAATGLVQDTANVFSGEGVRQATRQFDLSLDRYTSRIEDTVAFADRALSTDKLPRSVRILEAKARTMPVQREGTEPVIVKAYEINGITVEADSPAGQAFANFIDALEESSGQYLGG